MLFWIYIAINERKSEVVPAEQYQSKSRFESYFQVTFILSFREAWVCWTPGSFEFWFEALHFDTLEAMVWILVKVFIKLITSKLFKI